MKIAGRTGSPARCRSKAHFNRSTRPGQLAGRLISIKRLGPTLVIFTGSAYTAQAYRALCSNHQAKPKPTRTAALSTASINHCCCSAITKPENPARPAHFRYSHTATQPNTLTAANISALSALTALPPLSKATIADTKESAHTRVITNPLTAITSGSAG